MEQEYEYIRHHGVWQDFTTNLDTIRKLDHKISFNMLHFILNYKKYKNKIYQYQNHFVQVTDESNELYPFYYYSSLRNNLPWFEDDEYKFDLSYFKKNSTLNFKYQIDGKYYSSYLIKPMGNTKGTIFIIYDWNGLNKYEKS